MELLIEEASFQMRHIRCIEWRERCDGAPLMCIALCRRGGHHTAKEREDTAQRELERMRSGAQIQAMRTGGAGGDSAGNARERGEADL